MTDHQNQQQTESEPELWTMQMSEGGETYPFVEDENANITGLGHQDPVEFAAAINRYDAECNGGPLPDVDQWGPDVIGHRWAVLDADGERLHVCSAGTPGAVAITTLWNQR